MSRLTQGLLFALRVRGCHPLWPNFPDGSACLTKAAGLVRVRSPLLAESRLMSFPPATEMVQFAGFASCRYGFTAGYRLRGGLPHSEIRGSTGARPSPRLFAACHVLHRLSVPRHPPDALLVLAHAQPQGRAQGRAKRGQRLEARSWQRSEVRGQRSDQAGLPLLSVRCSAKPGVGSPLPGPPAPAYLHTHARARPSRRARPEGRGGFSCHARFTVTTRFTMSKRPPPPACGGRQISHVRARRQPAGPQPTPGGGPGPT